MNYTRKDRGTIRAARAAGGLLLALTVALSLSAAPVRADEHQVQLGTARATAAVRLVGGKSETIRTDRSFVDVVVGDEQIADVKVLTDRSLSILGKKTGTTRVSIYGDNKALIGIFDVEVTLDTSVLATELRERFPDAKFRVASINDHIMLSGTAPDAVTVDQAVSIAKQFGKEAAEVINSVRVMRPQQVMLAVRFVEASRNADRELGINWNVVAKNVNVTTGAALAGNTAPFGVLLAKLIGNGVEVDSMIQALEARGLVRLLAEPNLIALSGDTASFLAGGEFPFPVGSTNNGGNITITVAWKRYGVGLAFTPTVRENGVINLKIEPEVSQLDPNNGFEIDGVKLPSLTVRRANTTIELRDGQSFAIAGLLQTVSKTDQKQLPWLGEVPVLGTLFRSTAYQKQETDLAIIVTPHLVRPARPGDELKTPLDASVAGNDADLFIDGRAELTPREVREVVPAARTVKPLGHILDLPKGAS